MQTSKQTPEEYIQSLPADSAAAIKTLDELIVSVMPATEKRGLLEGKFWGGSEQRIIGYGDYTYVNNSKKQVNWHIVGLAQQKNYITVFVNAIENGAYLAEQWKDKLGKVKIGRSSISFKKLEDINLEELKKLVSRAFEVMR